MEIILRHVPANWEHPKNNHGKYIPMFDIYYGDALEEWLQNNEMWNNGTHPDLIENPKLKEKYPFYALWGSDAPVVKQYQTRKYKQEELTHIQIYETTSEGTPLTPVFAKEDFDSLCEYAAKNLTPFIKATKEEWKEILLYGFVISKK